MRRVTEIVFAILGAYLVLSMAPMAAAASSSEELVVGSQHDTQSEFSNAQKLTNLTTTSAGDGAVVLKRTSTTLDDFNDGDLAEYSGDSSIFSTSTSSPLEGTHSLKASTTKTNSIISRTDISRGQGTTFTYLYRGQSDGTNDPGGLAFAAQSATGSGSYSGYVAMVLPGEDILRVQKWSNGSQTTIKSVTVSNNIPEGTPLKVTVDWASDGTITITVESEDGSTTYGSTSVTDTTYTSGGIGWFTYSGTHSFDLLQTTGSTFDTARYVSPVHNVTGGEQAAINITALTNASVTATVRTPSGTTLNQTTLTTTGNHTLSLADYTGNQVEVELAVDITDSNPAFRLSDESILFTNHAPSADNSTAAPNATSTNNETVQLSINVSDQEFSTVQGDNVTVTAFVDGSAIGSKTISSNQTVTFTATGLSDGSHSWHVELEDEYGLTSQSDTFSFEVNHYAPVVDNTSAEPQGDAKQSSRDVNLSIPLEDVDFAEGSGDEVAVEFYVDGKLRDTVNVTANGTVSTTVTVSEGGNHTWHVKATDEYGQTTTSDTFGFKVPSELRVYKETKPSQLVDSVPVEIQFYFEGEDDLIVTRNATNGTINMTGLPVDQSFVVVAQDDSGDYYDRRIFVESLFETQSIYLLNKSEAAVTQRFELQDYSGDFPKEKSVLLVQRSINDTWQTVEGDRFGATGEFPTTLAKDQRHRLIVLNVETGKREEIGHITPTSDSLKTVKITSDQSIVLEPVEPVVLFDPSTNSVPAINNASIQGEIRNKSVEFDSWSIDVIAQNGTTGTNTTLYNETFQSATGGSVSPKVDLRNYTNGTLYVVMSYTAADGRTGNVTKVYDIDQHFANEYSALSVVDKISGQIDPSSRESIKTLIAVLATALLTTGAAASMGMSPELSGLTATASLAAFGLVGWVPYSLVTAAVFTMLAFGGLRRGI